AMVAHLKLLIAKMRRDRFGPSAERSRLLDQLELQLEELEASATEDEAVANADATPVRSFGRERPVWAPLPAYLPRERVVIPAAERVPVLWRQARQAGRGHHRDAGGGAPAMEGGPDSAREVHLSRS